MIASIPRWSFALALALFAAKSLAAQTNAIEMPPAPPGLKYQEVTPSVRLHELSPVEYFRTLLGMPAAQRLKVLANRSPEDRNAILAKVREYEAMPADIREARLHQTELLWNISSLMKLPAAKRAVRLHELSREDRVLVENHLQRWDRLPTDWQKAILEKAGFIGLYLRWQDSSAEEQKDILNRLPPNKRQEWSRALQQWQTLPQDQRQELCDRFRQLFELDGQRQQQVINGFTDAERHQMEDALQVFSHLSPDQRKICITSFQKFAVMTPQQRGEFLRNAERWQAMTTHERQVWRELVQKCPPLPPAPPGLDADLPPLPPGMNLSKPPAPDAAVSPAGAPPVPTRMAASAQGN